jgi:ferritin-like metal-binding protein YciE
MQTASWSFACKVTAVSNERKTSNLATQHTHHKIDLQGLLIDSLKDLYSSESQLIKALPKMVKAAESPELKEAFQNHLAETESQLDRVKKAFAAAGQPAKGELCKGMKGIVEEGDEQIEKKTGDLGLIGAGERVEHYEMASYQTAIAFAKQLGMDEVESLLSESLKEEENAAKLLTKISKKMLDQAPMAASAN